MPVIPESLRKSTMKVSQLVPYVGNAKEHPDWQVDQIAASIDAFGFNDPIAIWQDIAGHWIIVEGHGRLLAAKALGMDEVPVIRLDHLDDEGRRAYTLAHNKLTMNTDFDADSKGHIFRAALTDNGMPIRECLIWVKNSLVLGRQDYHWKHEPCLYGWKDGGSHNWYSDRRQTTVLEFDRPTANREHPTMKPVPLLAYLVRNSTKKGDLVLDTFGGSGSTLLACEKLGRVCCTMELDPHYCDVILQRFEDLTGRKATKVS